MIENFILASLVLFIPGTVTLVDRSSGLETPTKKSGKTEYELADINGDGHLDIISVGDHGSPGSHQHGITVWFGDGQGSWTVMQEGWFGYGGCALGDLNRDGFPDIAWGIHHDYGSGGLGDRLIGAALGNGTAAGWVPWGEGLASGGETYGMFAADLADFNNNGLLDLVCQSFGSGNGVHVYRNNGDGTWDHEWAVTGWNANYTLETGDFNADGCMDFICTRWGTGEYTNIYFGDGSFGFTLEHSGIPQKHIYSVDSGDFINNGADDIVVAMDSDSGVRAYSFNCATGLWEDRSSGLPCGETYSMVQFGHINGDEFLDVVAYAGTTGRVYLGDGQGSWTPDAVFSFSTPGYYSAMRVCGDFDHDGREDIVVQAAEGSIYDYTNQLRAYSPWLEPDDLSIRIVTPRGGEVFVEGSVRSIRWLTAVPPALGQASVDLLLSTTGPGGPWEPIALGVPDNCRHQWTVPAAASNTCRLMVSATAGASTSQYISPGDFTILDNLGISGPSSGPMPALSLSVLPNPCFSTPAARVSGIAEGPAELRVYDLTGRLLGAFSVDAGDTANIPLRNDDGSPLPCGTYAAVLQTSAGTVGTVFLQLR